MTASVDMDDETSKKDSLLYQKPELETLEQSVSREIADLQGLGQRAKAEGLEVRDFWLKPEWSEDKVSLQMHELADGSFRWELVSASKEGIESVFDRIVSLPPSDMRQSLERLVGEMRGYQPQDDYDPGIEFEDGRFEVEYEPRFDSLKIKTPLTPDLPELSALFPLLDHKKYATKEEFCVNLKRKLMDVKQRRMRNIENWEEDRRFIDTVGRTLGESSGWKELLASFSEAPSHIPGMEDVMREVNSASHDNFLRNAARELGILRLLGKTEQEAKIKIGGFEISTRDFQREEFWRTDFPDIVKKLIDDGSVRILHSVARNEHFGSMLEGGVGKESNLGNAPKKVEFIRQNDILSPHLRQVDALIQTYAILGMDHPFYRKGARGLPLIEFDPKGIGNRTLFFPSDTGDPDAMLDIRDGFVEDRKAKVLNLPYASALFLLRHIIWSSTGKSKEDYLGHFEYVEVNIIGPVEISKGNVSRVMFREDEEGENTKTIEELKTRGIVVDKR